MPEGFPKKTVEEMDSNERTDRSPQYRTVAREVIEERRDGMETVRVVECNGIHHRRCVDKISYDEKGDITFVDQLSREELGSCDGNHP